VALGYYAREGSLFESAATARSPRRAKVVADVVAEVAAETDNPDQV